MENIIEMTKETSDHPKLGKVFGYSVDEYAIATLKWLGEEEKFIKCYEELSDYKKRRIDELIDSKCFNELW